ncbi:UDP-glucose 4-epimerase [Alphaproteobacteria bacterium SO-S41]|nr:UDP-glucose 4-epimerase [Alphaproteobacteria bacterium SO-S41]
MKILVTGGAGYVGSHACKALALAGHQPVVFDHLGQGKAELVQWGPLEIGDIRDAARLDAVMAAHRPDAVIHFAALSVVRDSVSDPATYYRSNVAGTIELLDAMRRAEVKRIVFSSTAAVYGLPETSPVPEEALKAPINPYGVTKLTIEHALADYGRAYGLQWAALRYFNAAGADPDGQLGELHEPETHAIPLAIEALLSGGTFNVFGQDYATPDGTCIRDYVHVSDLGEAHLKAVEYLAAGGASRAFNLGSGTGASVLEILNAIERVAGKPVPVVYGDRRPGDPPSLIADSTAARTILGWTPTRSDIQTIARTALAWHRKMGTRHA